MKGQLILLDGTSSEASLESARRSLADGTFFWLDLDGLDDEASGLLRQELGFHHLAVEDAEEFGQRPKVEEYDGFTYFVVHGATAAAAGSTATMTDEVHIFYSERHVVTVHHGECGAVATACKRLQRHKVSDLSPPEIGILYLVVDCLVDSYFPVLSELDDRIDALEDDILRLPTEAQLGELFEMKRRLVTLRKVVTPQRDMFATLLSGTQVLPGMTTEDERYFRDLYDHLIRVSDLVDSYRDLLTGAMDTHVSTVSNRLNVVMKQLTIIATVFLPLSYLTGFFGQNFSLMTGSFTNHSWTFWVFGIGLELAAAGALIFMFRRRGWLGGPTA